MNTSNTRTRYGTVAMILHWLIAALIIINLYLGLSFDTYPKGDPAFPAVLALHQSIGLSVLMLSVLRVVWRLMNPVPPLPAGMNPALRFTARATHALLYFLIIAIPLSGWAMVSASRSGKPAMYFGLFQWPSIGFLSNLPRAQKMPLHENLEGIHTVLAWSAIVLVILHILGALYHQFRMRDDVMKRMLPRTKVAGEV